MNADIFKLIVILIAFIYFNVEIRLHTKPINYWIMNLGLLLLLFASVLDFADGVQELNNVPILGRNAPFHDTLEDQICDTPGLALFAFGAFRQMLAKFK